uniref:Carbonic anhydrase n=1 Tax=Lepisosteus oculatus TaxID=7918 RepID=W5MKX7_LEPOC
MLGKVFLVFILQTLLFLTIVVSSTSSSEEDSSVEKESKEHHKGSHHWKYDDQELWPSTFEHCSGKSQSPINIETGKTIYDSSLPAIVLEGYDLSDKALLKLQNNGHTLQLNLPSTMHIVQGFDNMFIAAQLHFHWGTKEVPGSEHTIDNVHFPAEIHVVHYNSKYASLQEAATKPDGLAVLGGFIGIGLLENENYENILSSLTDVSLEETNTEIPGFNVRHLLPPNLERFYRYNGSLTTPPCFQTVNWTVFNDTISVSRKQLAALEDTLKAGQSLLSRNFRAAQLLHGREVYSSFKTLETTKVSESTVSLVVQNNVKSCATITSLTGYILAIAFGALFAITLLSFIIYAVQQRKKYSRFQKDSRQNVIYKPATKEEA